MSKSFFFFFSVLKKKIGAIEVMKGAECTTRKANNKENRSAMQ